MGTCKFYQHNEDEKVFSQKKQEIFYEQDNAKNVLVVKSENLIKDLEECEVNYENIAGDFATNPQHYKL